MRCFACNRGLGKSPQLVDTHDGQLVYVGRECFKLIAAAGEQGYQPPLGGPKLFAMPKTSALRKKILMLLVDKFQEFDFSKYPVLALRYTQRKTDDLPAWSIVARRKSDGVLVDFYSTETMTECVALGISKFYGDGSSIRVISGVNL